MKSSVLESFRGLGTKPIWRSLIWRIARRIYTTARGDVRNDPSSNGEYALVRRVVGLLRCETKQIFLDVGANRGDWSAALLNACSAQGIVPIVHAFEPCSSTYMALSERFASAEDITEHRLALSDSSGTRELFVVAPLAGTNSLSSRHGGSPELVNVETVDKFLTANEIRHVTMVKTDTEGFDFAVMQGARIALSKRLIDLWQFEYNWRWIDCKRYLRDVFDLAATCGYHVGRVIPSGHIELYEAWNPELERFFEANYCLVNPGWSWCDALCSRYRFGRSNVLELVSRAQ